MMYKNLFDRMLKEVSHLMEFLSFSAMIIGIMFYLKSVIKNMQLQRKEIEQRAMSHYMNELEVHFKSMRAFKHDYQNILISMDSYFKEEDYSSLKKYYYDEIKVASDKILNIHFRLNDLSHIKMKEIKGILITKLMMAHELGIEFAFEAPYAIEQIPMDSMDFIRIIGIILDNAIEAMSEQKEGKLQIGLLREESGDVIFIVQNPCQFMMHPLHKLKQPGFSTKGSDRGLGLNNLDELVAKYPHVFLETLIEDHHFLQKVIIAYA